MRVDSTAAEIMEKQCIGGTGEIGIVKGVPRDRVLNIVLKCFLELETCLYITKNLRIFENRYVTLL